MLRPDHFDLNYIPFPNEPSRLSLEVCLKKSLVSPAINLGFLVKSTYGSSRADLTEICQKAARLAIRQSFDAVAPDPGEAREV